MDITTKFSIIWERTVKVGIATDPALRTALVLKLVENGNFYRLHDPTYALMISAEFLAVALRTGCSLAVYAANSPKNRDRQQSERRNWRAGQSKTCTYVDLAVQGTVDERWVRRIREKMDVAGALVGDQWRAWLV